MLTWYGLRQQTPKETDEHGHMRPSRCLADFVAPLDAKNLVATTSENSAANGLPNARKMAGDYAGCLPSRRASVPKREQAFAAAR